MKLNTAKFNLTVLTALLLCLCACSGKHESQGKEIGKKFDQFEKKAEKFHDRSKEKAHGLIDKA